MTSKPTEEAEWAFNRGYSTLYHDGGTTNVGIALALQEMCTGLASLSVGLRATYNLLEEVRQQQGRQSRLSAGAFSGKPGT